MKELYISQRLAARVQGNIVTAVIRPYSQNVTEIKPGDMIRLYFRRRSRLMRKNGRGEWEEWRPARRKTIAKVRCAVVYELRVVPDAEPPTYVDGDRPYQILANGVPLDSGEARMFARAAGCRDVQSMVRRLPLRRDDGRHGRSIGWEIPV